jgi:recombination protein RecR
VITLPEKLTTAIEAIAKMPGIGKKSAGRIALTLAKWNNSSIEDIANGIMQIKDINKCVSCGMYSDDRQCSICLNVSRNNQLLCVVEGVNDLIAIESSGQFRGTFLILGGVLNPLLGLGPDSLNIDMLLNKIKLNNIEEIILALNPSVEGDATCSYLKQLIPAHVKINRIGFGIPIGGNLEYLDPQTISKAFENKRLL